MKDVKDIKMSLETARKMYAKGDKETNDWLLENFTKEELEKKEGFTWEDSFGREGFYITSDVSEIRETTCQLTNSSCKNIFKTRKQAESALAFAQLSHIVAKYNEEKECFKSRWVICSYNKCLVVLSCYYDFHHLEFYDEKDAETSLKVNRELWEKYWMI